MELITGATFVFAIQLGIVVLLNVVNPSLANRLLGFLLLIFFLSAKYFLLDYIQADWLVRFFQGLSSSPFYGPLAYLFLLSLSGKLQRVDYLKHLAFPGLLVLFYLADDLWGILGQSLLIKTYVVVEYGLVIVYCLLCFAFFRRGGLEHIKIQNRYRLFYTIIFADLVYNFGELALSIFAPEFHARLMPGLFQFDMVVYLLLFLYLTLFGLTELSWVRQLFVPKQIYFSQGYMENDTLEMTLKQLFEKEAIHLDPDLTIEELAKAAQVSRPVLSEYLTIKRKLTFNELVNEYRLETFKSKLGDPQYAHLDIIGIAYAAGFGSKATFYRVFKQKEGMTPSAFKKAQKRKD